MTEKSVKLLLYAREWNRETANLHLLVLQNRWKWGMIEKREIIVLISRKKYSPRSFYFHHKTTACFTKNNGSFYQKQRLVLSKITACFTKNDGSFYQEQRLVLLKTTAWFTTKKNKCRSFCSDFSPYPHPILLFHKPSQGKNCANTTNLRRNKSHNTK